MTAQLDEAIGPDPVRVGSGASGLGETASRPETRGIELVDDTERHGRARDLVLVWAAPGVSILNLTVGATLILLGLEVWQAISVILAAAVLWILPGLIAASGPAAGTSGSIITRAMYGVLGNRVFVTFAGWLIGAVYMALTWLASSFMGADLLRRVGLDDPVWVPIGVTAVVATITILVAIFGHALILRVYPVLAAVLLVVFVAVTVAILPTVDWSYTAPVPLEGISLVSAISIGFTILASAPLSFINSPDIARYLPRSTQPWRIALATAVGGGLPFTIFTIVGVLLATGLDAAAVASGIDAVIFDLLPVWLGPVLVAGVVLNTIALAAMTAYTSSMSLQAIGLRLRRIPAAIIVGLVGTALTIALVLTSSLLQAVNLMLQFLVTVAGPAMTIFVVDVLLRRLRYDGVELFDERPGSRYWYTGGWGLPGLVALVAGGAAAAACLATTVWVGPLALAMGVVDLSVPAGVLVAGTLYALLQRTPIAKDGHP